MRYLRPAGRPDIHYWETEIGLDLFPWLADYRVGGRPILPVAACIVAALSAAEEALGTAGLGESDFAETMFIDPEKAQTLQFSICGAPSCASFEVFGLTAGTAPNNGGWCRHAGGKISVGPVTEVWAPLEREPFQRGSERSITAAAFYQAMQAAGLEYGPGFRNIDTIWVGADEAMAPWGCPSRSRGMCPTSASIPQLSTPASRRCCRWCRRQRTRPPLVAAPCRPIRLVLGPAAAAHAALGSRLARPGVDAEGSSFTGDVFLLADDGRVLLEVRGLRLICVDRVAADLGEMMFEVEWHPRHFST